MNNYGQQIVSAGPPEGFVRKKTSGSRREKTSGVGITHHPGWERRLFIGKDEAYIMNRKKKAMSMLRKEGNVYVLDLFVRVPSSVAAPIVYTPTEVDPQPIEVADGREPRRRVTIRCNRPTF